MVDPETEETGTHTHWTGFQSVTRHHSRTFTHSLTPMCNSSTGMFEEEETREPRANWEYGENTQTAIRVRVELGKLESWILSTLPAVTI